MWNMSYARALSPALSIAEIMAYSPASGSDLRINGVPFEEVEVIVDEKTAQILNDYPAHSFIDFALVWIRETLLDTIIKDGRATIKNFE